MPARNASKERGEARGWQEEGELVPERIYVGDLAPGLVTDLQLGRFFAQFGQVSGAAATAQVTHSVVIGDRGYGFVTFGSAAPVAALLGRREALVLEGRRLTLRQVTGSP